MTPDRRHYDEMLTAAQQLTTRLCATLNIRVTASEYGYPTSGSTAEKQRANNTEEHAGERFTVTPDTVPEKLAIAPDLAAKEAARIEREVKRITERMRTLEVDVATWSPDRAVPKCQRCDTILLAPGADCRAYFDGVRCGHEPKVAACDGCGDPLKAGDSRKGKCNKCRMKGTRAAATAAARGSETINVTDVSGMLTTEGNES